RRQFQGQEVGGGNGQARRRRRGGRQAAAQEESGDRSAICAGARHREYAARDLAGNELRAARRDRRRSPREAAQGIAQVANRDIRGRLCYTYRMSSESERLLVQQIRQGDARAW